MLLMHVAMQRLTVWCLVQPIGWRVMVFGSPLQASGGASGGGGVPNRCLRCCRWIWRHFHGFSWRWAKGKRPQGGPSCCCVSRAPHFHLRLFRFLGLL